MPKPETVIENAVCEYARSRRGMLVRKFVSPHYRGVPDRLFIPFWAPIFFVEFKAPGEEPRPDQVREHEKIRAQGHSVFVVDDIEEGKRIVDFIAALAAPPIPE